MRRTLTTLLLLCILGTQLRCGGSAPPPPPRAQARAIAAANNHFAAELYAKLRAQNAGNFFFSPYSIGSAFAMIHAGAAGQTQAEIAAVLHIKDTVPEVNDGYDALTDYLNAGAKTGSYQLSIANALWGQADYGFHKSYTGTLQKSYSAGLFEIDFQADPQAARQRINDWVAQQTKDRIKDLMPAHAISPDTRFVLANAIYFKGDWLHAFDKKDTSDGPFDTADGKQVIVPFMYQKNDVVPYLDDVDFKAIDLAYKKSSLVMTVLLPHDKAGLDEFEKKLTGDALINILAKLKDAGIHSVPIYLPKFKMDSAFDLNKTLTHMGMPTAFTDKADLSGINGKRDLYIQAASHKAFIEVTEEGTEAAAATRATLGVKSAGDPRPIIFKADHPFLFLVRDRATGAILFMGRVTNPE